MAIERPGIVFSQRCIIQREDKRVLLLKRADTDAHAPGLWEFPGGKIDFGEIDEAQALLGKEVHLAALLREIWEETGLVPTNIAPLASLSSRVILDGPYTGYIHLVATYDGKIASVTEVKLRPHEHSQFIWETWPIMARDYSLTREARKAIDDFLAEGTR
jgi:8-oxo-dGTP pyrophosphatase MutT (NUDIX family)